MANFHKLATTNRISKKSILLDMHHHKTYMHINFQQNRVNRLVITQGRSQDLAGGPRIFFFRFGNLHVAKRHAAHGEATLIARGVREIFFKLYNLVRFSVYF